MTDTKKLCNLCGEPMHPSEDMFNYHGYSGPCPKPPISMREFCRGLGLRDEYVTDMIRRLRERIDKQKGTMTDTTKVPPVDVDELRKLAQFGCQAGHQQTPRQLLALVELVRELSSRLNLGVTCGLAAMYSPEYRDLPKLFNDLDRICGVEVRGSQQKATGTKEGAE